MRRNLPPLSRCIHWKAPCHTSDAPSRTSLRKIASARVLAQSVPVIGGICRRLDMVRLTCPKVTAQGGLRMPPSKKTSGWSPGHADAKDHAGTVRTREDRRVAPGSPDGSSRTGAAFRPQCGRRKWLCANFMLHGWLLRLFTFVGGKAAGLIEARKNWRDAERRCRAVRQIHGRTASAPCALA